MLSAQKEIDGYNGFRPKVTVVSIPYDMKNEMVFYNVITYILDKHDVLDHTGMPNKDGIAFVNMRSYSKAEYTKVLRCAKELLKKQKDATLTERYIWQSYDAVTDTMVDDREIVS